MSHHDEFDSRDDWPAVGKTKPPVQADPLDLPALLTEADQVIYEMAAKNAWNGELWAANVTTVKNWLVTVRALRDALVQQHEALRIAQRFADAWRADAGQADAALAESREQLARVQLDCDAHIQLNTVLEQRHRDRDKDDAWRRTHGTALATIQGILDDSKTTDIITGDVTPLARSIMQQLAESRAECEALKSERASTHGERDEARQQETLSRDSEQDQLVQRLKADAYDAITRAQTAEWRVEEFKKTVSSLTEEISATRMLCDADERVVMLDIQLDTLGMKLKAQNELVRSLEQQVAYWKNRAEQATSLAKQVTSLELQVVTWKERAEKSGL
jgi:hypothetical protein